MIADATEDNTIDTNDGPQWGECARIVEDCYHPCICTCLHFPNGDQDGDYTYRYILMHHNFVNLFIGDLENLHRTVVYMIAGVGGKFLRWRFVR